MPISIAIDGPASSGKGTVARGVARALHYHYVDTGAMYRAVALVAMRRGVPWEDSEELGALASGLRFRFEWDDDDVLHVIVDDEDVTRAIREDALGTGASTVSRHPEVREALLGLQRALGRHGAIVMDGRDIGTVVLPGAELKVYLDADLDERARRRHDELLRRGESYTFDEVKAGIHARDQQDSGRAAAPLRVAEDAVVVDTTELSIPQAIRKVLELAHQRGA